MDKNNTSKKTTKRRNQRQYSGVAPLRSLVNIPKWHKIWFLRYFHAL